MAFGFALCIFFATFAPALEISEIMKNQSRQLYILALLPLLLLAMPCKAELTPNREQKTNLFALCRGAEEEGKSQLKPLNIAKLDSFFNAVSSQYMGSVAISVGGTTVYRHSTGYADIQADIKASEKSKYMIGSISKTFTAILTFMAVDEGRLSLDDKLSRFFPDKKLTNADKITIDNLLYHRSGIHDIFEGEGDYLQWYTQYQSRDVLIARIAAAGADTIPDAVQQYCNAGYVLLTFILEDLYGKSYSQLLQEKLAQPLHLSNTSVGDGIDPLQNECRSYSYKGGWQLEPETHPSVPQGAGVLMSNPDDLLKFANALFGNQLGNNILQRMETINGSLGRGLFPFVFYEKRGFGHTGGIDGFQSVLCHFDEGNVTVALCSNGNNLNQNDILITVLNAVYGKDYEIPTFNYAVLDAETLNRYVGEYESRDLHMTIKVTTDGKTLTAQAAGQMAFGLEAENENTFSFAKAGIKIAFESTNLILYQAGQKIVFTRK